MNVKLRGKVLQIAKAVFKLVNVDGLDLYAHAIATGLNCRNGGRSGSGERIDNNITSKTEHANEAPRNFKRKRGRMVTAKLAGYICPNWSKPSSKVAGGNERTLFHFHGRFPIPAGLAEE